MDLVSRRLVYDAAPILGLGKRSNDPLPDSVPGQVVIRVGAWSLKDLNGQGLKWEEWLDKYDFCHQKLTPGVYRVRPCIPCTTKKNFTEQCECLSRDERVAPIALVAAVLLCHLKQKKKDLLNGGWTRCAELYSDGLRAVLDGGKKLVYVNYYPDKDRTYLVGLAGYRKG
jgi:hypothetical protein